MLFGVNTHGGPRNTMLDGGPDPGLQTAKNFGLLVGRGHNTSRLRDRVSSQRVRQKTLHKLGFFKFVNPQNNHGGIGGGTMPYRCDSLSSG